MRSMAELFRPARTARVSPQLATTSFLGQTMSTVAVVPLFRSSWGTARRGGGVGEVSAAGRWRRKGVRRGARERGGRRGGTGRGA